VDQNPRQLCSFEVALRANPGARCVRAYCGHDVEAHVEMGEEGGCADCLTFTLPRLWCDGFHPEHFIVETTSGSGYIYRRCRECLWFEAIPPERHTL
jgi:hypothetical protein